MRGWNDERIASLTRTLSTGTSASRGSLLDDRSSYELLTRRRDWRKSMQGTLTLPCETERKKISKEEVVQNVTHEHFRSGSCFLLAFAS